MRSFANRPFPSSKKSHFQSEAKCEAIDMKMIFNYDANKTHFHNKGFALSLVLKVRFFGTRKWPIGLYPSSLSVIFQIWRETFAHHVCSCEISWDFPWRLNNMLNHKIVSAEHPNTAQYCLKALVCLFLPKGTIPYFTCFSFPFSLVLSDLGDVHLYWLISEMSTGYPV